MAISITHPFVSSIPDGADATVVRPSNWNATHSIADLSAISKLMGSGSAAATPTEITLGTNLTMSGTTLNAASGSSTWDTIGAAAGDATTANSTRRIVYQTAPSTDSRIAWRFTESAAATNGTSSSGVPNQVLLQLDTVAASTQSPLKILSRGNFVLAVSPSTRQLLLDDTGGTSVPALAGVGSTTSGFGFNGANSPVIIVSGARIAQFNDRLYMTGGSSNTPAITDLNNGNTGLAWLGADQVSFVNGGGGEMMRWNSGSVQSVKKFYPATDAAALQTSSALYANTGAPNNSNGADGDFYFRADGGALTSIYQRRAGAWVGLI